MFFIIINRMGIKWLISWESRFALSFLSVKHLSLLCELVSSGYKFVPLKVTPPGHYKSDVRETVSVGRLFPFCEKIGIGIRVVYF